MTSTLEQPAPAKRVPARGPLARFGLLTGLGHPRQVFGSITPNWYASIMGTGIVATAAASLPLQFAGLRAFGVVYGVPVWGFALLWAALAAAITVRTARRHLPFSLTWWSFTFPVGTCVTGTSGLALHTGSVMFHWAAVACYAGLLAAWVTVAARTAHGSARGRLFLPPPAVPAAGGD